MENAFVNHRGELHIINELLLPVVIYRVSRDNIMFVVTTRGADWPCSTSAASPTSCSRVQVRGVARRPSASPRSVWRWTRPGSRSHGVESEQLQDRWLTPARRGVGTWCRSCHSLTHSQAQTHMLVARCAPSAVAPSRSEEFSRKIRRVVWKVETGLARSPVRRKNIQRSLGNDLAGFALLSFWEWQILFTC